jgi:hypothetical protein
MMRPLPYLDDTCIHSKDLDGHYVAMKESV